MSHLRIIATILVLLYRKNKKDLSEALTPALASDDPAVKTILTQIWDGYFQGIHGGLRLSTVEDRVKTVNYIIFMLSSHGVIDRLRRVRKTPYNALCSFLKMVLDALERHESKKKLNSLAQVATK